MGPIPYLVKPKTFKLVFAASPKRLQHEGVRAKIVAWIQNNVTEWSDMSSLVILF